MVNTIVGLDLAATLKDDKVGAAILQREGEKFVLVSARLIKHTSQITDLIYSEVVRTPVLMAIDAPRSFILRYIECLGVNLLV